MFILLSLALAALICQYKGDAWEEKVRIAFFTVRNDSIPNYAKTIIDEIIKFHTSIFDHFLFIIFCSRSCSSLL